MANVYACNYLSKLSRKVSAKFFDQHAVTVFLQSRITQARNFSFSFGILKKYLKVDSCIDIRGKFQISMHITDVASATLDPLMVSLWLSV